MSEFEIVKFTEFDVLPPGLMTVMGIVAGVVSRLAGIATVKDPEFTNPAGSRVVPNWTWGCGAGADTVWVEPGAKLLPRMFKVSGPLPAGAEGGLRLVIDGGDIANAAGAEVESFGWSTEMAARPAAASRFPGIKARSCLSETNVVPRGVSTLLNFHST